MYEVEVTVKVKIIGDVMSEANGRALRAADTLLKKAHDQTGYSGAYATIEEKKA